MTRILSSRKENNHKGTKNETNMHDQNTKINPSLRTDHPNFNPILQENQTKSSKHDKHKVHESRSLSSKLMAFLNASFNNRYCSWHLKQTVNNNKNVKQAKTDSKRKWNRPLFFTTYLVFQTDRPSKYFFSKRGSCY